ncbi:AMP-binding protein [Gorillibacterium sp. CAU 1737]|uniref:AMP-binding protein n=1 Tax=Gorillibacterium sp. CAU 1737 TaxID=3140362 RepID=UPI0032610D08
MIPNPRTRSVRRYPLARLLGTSSMAALVRSIHRHGINLLALVEYAARLYPDRPAVADEREALTYRELAASSEQLAKRLRDSNGLTRGQRVGTLCRNSAAFIRLIIAVSRTGADLVLLNPELSNEQVASRLQEQRLDWLVHDEDAAERLEARERRTRPEQAYSSGETLGVPLPQGLKRLPLSLLAGEALDERAPGSPLARSASGGLVLLTSGTTGKAKEAEHKPSLFAYLGPFFALTNRLKLTQANAAYLATPLSHGYGLAVLFVFLALGRKTVVRPRFEAAEACRAVREHQVEVMTAVPLMVEKMLAQDPEAMTSLRCIAAGGAVLSPRLVEEVTRTLGPVLHNLYGTSEAGLTLIAAPGDLCQSAVTIGRRIPGVRVRIEDASGREAPPDTLGVLSVRSRSAMASRRRKWTATGDIGYRDRNGLYYLGGRTDDLVVSAGENVYPLEVEQVLRRHPLVADAAVIGVPDEAFGQRLKGFIVPLPGASLTADELLAWLRAGRLARYQMPRELVFREELPYTPLGKPDKASLKAEGEAAAAKGRLNI